jgi:preprotein translocase subunit SecY
MHWPTRGNYKLLFVAWFLAGLICILLDECIQPWLTSIGRQEPVRDAAEIWTKAGASPGIVLFIVAGVCLGEQKRGQNYFLDNGAEPVRFERCRAPCDRSKMV